MAIFLKSYAFKTGKQLIITLQGFDERSVVKWAKTFVLPTKSSEFLGSAEELWNSADKPTFVSKESYTSGFIEHTINQPLESINVEALNNHYKTLFEENETYESFLNKQKAAIEQEKSQLAAKTEQIVEEYETAQEGVEPISESTGISSVEAFAQDPHSDRYTGPDFGDSEEQEDIDASSEDIAPGMPPPPVENIDTSLPANRPTAGGNRPVVDLTGLSNNSAAVLGTLPKDTQAAMLGIGGDKLIEPVPAPLLYPGDASLIGENNSGIILSRDELYRLKGHTKSGACYIFAGRSPNNIQTEGVVNNSNEVQPLKKANDLVRDAAYLYLSQKADPAELLKVAGGTYAKAVGGTQPRQGVSLAAIKADDVVVMSRECGIRLITGTDKTNSRGGEQFAKFGIDLIAGNNDSDLQPLVKGDNLKIYLQGLSNSVDQLRSILYNFITSQISFNTTLQNHQHYDPFAIFLGSAGAGNPVAMNGGQNYISLQLFEAGTKALLEGAQMQMNCIAQMRNRVNNDMNGGILPNSNLGSYKIVSEKNRTN